MREGGRKDKREEEGQKGEGGRTKGRGRKDKREREEGQKGEGGRTKGRREGGRTDAQTRRRDSSRYTTHICNSRP